jgi:hypothetical protein
MGIVGFVILPTSGLATVFTAAALPPLNHPTSTNTITVMATTTFLDMPVVSFLSLQDYRYPIIGNPCPFTATDLRFCARKTAHYRYLLTNKQKMYQSLRHYVNGILLPKCIKYSRSIY